jgi:transketolase
VRSRRACPAWRSRGVSGFWHKYVGANDDPSAAIIGIDRFGESAPAGVLPKHFGFTVENVVAAVKRVMAQ